MGRGVLTVLAFLAGAFAGYLMSLGVYVVLSSLGVLYDREGGVAMAFAFAIGPMVALASGVAAAIVFARRSP